MERPFAITLDVGSSRANKTGSWRTERPVYVHRLAPCSSVGRALSCASAPCGSVLKAPPPATADSAYTI